MPQEAQESDYTEAQQDLEGRIYRSLSAIDELVEAICPPDGVTAEMWDVVSATKTVIQMELERSA